MTSDQLLARRRAVSQFADCDADALTQIEYGHYGLLILKDEAADVEFAVGGDIEADEAAELYIKDSLWAFNASFVVEQCDLPYELVGVLQAFMEDRCEGANDAIAALVERVGLHEFAEAAVQADGRGHFLSTYDGQEREADGFYIYRL